MQLKSKVFDDGQPIPQKYSCEGENVNPPLEIIDAPKESKSLALVVEDPDAPAGTWIHWMVWNISPETKEINEKEIPEGAVVGPNSSGENTYSGPCPPENEHRYFFKLYALDEVLELSGNTDKTKFDEALKEHALAETQLMGRYQKANIRKIT